LLHTRNGTVQGYNAQAVTTLEQVIVAAELTCEANDVHQLKPMLQATATTLAAAGIGQRPKAALADSGYWSIDNLTTLPDAPELLIPPARHGRQGKPRVEPVFGQLKEQQGARRFLRRGLRACNAEWKLLCGTHNLLKLWRHTATQPATRPATT
jgi:Transposase DDE domain